jgi:hypothetical protein
MISEEDIIQSSLIIKSSKYLSHCKKKGVEISLSPFCDLTSWVNSLGYQKLILIKNNTLFSKNYIKFLFSELINVGRYRFDYFISKKNFFKNKKRINIIYSYSFRENYKNNVFFDNYFKISSKDNNFFFILISMDGFIPKNVKNCLIIKRTQSFFNPLIFFSHLFKKILRKNFFHKFNSTNIFNEFVIKIFDNEVANKRINLFIPYESRPHQNAMILAAKKHNKLNKTICYLHNMPWPFQLDMIYKGIKIDKLIVSSNIQRQMFVNSFFWPKKTVKVIPSLRFKQLDNREKTIFLPFDLTEDSAKLINSFKDLLNQINFDLKNYKISIHPLKKFSKKHLELKSELLDIIKRERSNDLKKKEVAPIILSHPGGTATECLQVCGKVYHVTTDNLHVFSNKIWKKVKILKIKKNLYKYISKNIKFLKINKKTSIKDII